jgi:hypothetical protein
MSITISKVSKKPGFRVSNLTSDFAFFP